MFGESERCIMHKNTTDLKIQENLLTNKDLDRLISRGLDVHNLTAKKEQNMSTWESGTFLTNLSDSKPKPENILLQNIKPLPWGRLD